MFSSQSRLKLHSSQTRGSAEPETTGHGDAQSENIVIPEYVERSPTDILKVSWVFMNGTVGSGVDIGGRVGRVAFCVLSMHDNFVQPNIHLLKTLKIEATVVPRSS